MQSLRKGRLPPRVKGAKMSLPLMESSSWELRSSCSCERLVGTKDGGGGGGSALLLVGGVVAGIVDIL